MEMVSKRTLTVVALVCACCVVFAGTAHLLHCTQFFGHKHKHGKAVPDVLSNLAPFSLRTADLFSDVTPRLTIFSYSRLDLETKATRDDDILRILIGRAPPSQLKTSNPSPSSTFSFTGQAIKAVRLLA